MLPVVTAASLAVWLLRDFAIWLLVLQRISRHARSVCLAADRRCAESRLLRFGYLVIAKASLRFYLLTEVSQFVLLSAFSRWLIPLHGAAGAAQAYMATYIAYFALCAGVFIIYRRRV